MTKKSGANSYTVNFGPGKLPPVKEFWSLTMYDLTNNLWRIIDWGASPTTGEPEETHGCDQNQGSRGRVRTPSGV